MKLDRLQELVTTTAITLSGILVAVFLGQWAGRGDSRHITMILGSLAYILIFFKMRQNIWLLIPMLMPLDGQLGFLPLPFSAKQVGIIIVAVSFMALIALKIVTTRPKYDLLDLTVLINLLYSATVYARNPIGTFATGSDLIGGRPYLDLLIGVMGYWTLCRVSASSEQLRKIPLFMFASTAVVTGLSIVSNVLPFTAPIMRKLYTGIDTQAYSQSLAETGREDPNAGGEEAMVREQFFAPFAGSLTTILVSYYNPTTLLNPLYLLRFGSFMVCVGTMLISGHRSGFSNMFLIFFLSCFLREKFGGVFRMLLLVAMFFTILIMGHGTVYDLPLSVQRSLSFLPGKWDPHAKKDAEDSTEWRMVMWKKAMGSSALESTKYIKNKLFGDGPGFSKRDFASFDLDTGEGGNSAQQENLMLAGGFHSGPVSTVRNVGFVGGILFYVLMIYTACRAYTLIVRSRGTPFFATALFIGMPMMLSPLGFSFIFGSFSTDFPNCIFTVGFLKMIDQSLTASLVAAKSASPAVKAELRTAGSRPVPAFVGRPLGGGVQTSKI